MEKKKTPTKAVAKKAPVKKADKKENLDLQKLSLRIRSIRKSLGYTNADFFAYEHNVSRAQYARYEKLSGEDIRFSSLMKIIRAFGMTPQEFFSKGFD